MRVEALMQTFGTGMRYRSEIGTRWPEQGEPEQGEAVSQGLDPLHTCEVPPEMYPAREKLASKWVGLTHGAYLVPVAKAPARKPRKRAS